MKRILHEAIVIVVPFGKLALLEQHIANEFTRKPEAENCQILAPAGPELALTLRRGFRFPR